MRPLLLYLMGWAGVRAQDKESGTAWPVWNLPSFSLCCAGVICVAEQQAKL